MRENYYEVLGVPTTATTSEIKMAYQNKINRNNQYGNEGHADFIRLKIAHDILSNPKSRKEYNKLIHCTDSETIFHAPRSDNRQPEEPGGKVRAEHAPAFTFHWKPYALVLCTVIVTLLVSNFVRNQSQPTSSGNASTAYTTSSPTLSATNLKSSSATPTVSPAASSSPEPQKDSSDKSNSEPAPVSNSEKVKSTPDQLASASVKPKENELSKPEPKPVESKPVESKTPEPKPSATQFTLGSTKDEVRAVMGEPSSILKLSSTGDKWYYGLSNIDFNTSGNVKGWSGINNGKATLGDKKADNVTFTLNSTKQEVVDAMGTPDSILNLPSTGDKWYYGLSNVDFNTSGNVKGWSSIRNGKAFMGSKIPGAAAIQEGSTKQQVLDLYGTPDSILNLPSTGDKWYYGLSSVDFNTSGKVKGWSNLK